MLRSSSGAALLHCSPGHELRCEIKFRGHPHEVGDGIGVHLSHKTSAVSLHRDLADPKCSRYLLVQPTGDYSGHDFALTPAERRVMFAQRLRPGLPATFRLTTLDSRPNRAQQHLSAE